MREPVKRSALAAVGLGEGAGAVFAAVLVIWSAVAGQHALAPLHLFASLALGPKVLGQYGPLGVVWVGAMVNIFMSGVYGFVYGFINGRLPMHSHLGLARQIGLGALYGLAVYLVSFQVFGRLVFPWVLEQRQLPYLLAHVLVFGPLLGVMYTIAERREVRGDHFSTSAA
jgi:hypothetical protein